MGLYGLYGPLSRELLTYRGRVLVHGDRAELEWLFPGCPVREVPPSIPAEQTFPVEHHPDMTAVQFPLRREDFR